MALNHLNGDEIDNVEQPKSKSTNTGVTKRNDPLVPIDKLDFKYVESCNDVKELEKIYKVLVSGAEGKYLELENFTRKRIESLAPNSRVLRKDAPILTKTAMAKTEQTNLDNDIENFIKSIPDLEKKLTTKPDFEELPPVRSTSSTVLLKGSTKKEEASKPREEHEPNVIKSMKKSPKPKDYSEWSKIEKNLDENEQKAENEQTKSTEATKTTRVSGDRTVVNDSSAKSLIKDLPKNIKNLDLDDEAKSLKAEREKIKGNEAFGSGSYEEALAYYTRSIQLMPNAAALNNRALTYLKLENWDKVIDDCNSVFKYEKDNVKALFRRGMAHFRKKNFTQALNDMQRCLSLDPNDKKAQELLKEIAKEERADREDRERVKSLGGKRIQIEDTDGSENEADYEEKVIKISGDEDENTESGLTPVQIAEVESDDDDDDSTENSKPNQVSKDDLPKEQPKEEIRFELDPKLVEEKDKANREYQNGQYGDAIRHFSHVIDQLNSRLLTCKNESESSEIRSHLSILYNNRASSYEHICDFKACIDDCNRGLEQVNKSLSSQQQPSGELTLKLVYKKAHSLEMCEKYADALAEYEKIMQIDSRFKSAQERYNRVKKVLADSLGTAISSSTKTKVEHSTTTTTTKSSYDDLKTKGNECVKRNDFAAALDYYTQCIDVDAEQCAAYLNRSLCFIKLNRPHEALSDTSYVLGRERDNVKALYRRALALRMLGDAKSAKVELDKLLRVEPNNKMALDELNSVKDELKSKAKPKSPEAFEPVKVKPTKTYDFSNISNAYEFLQAWHSIEPSDHATYARLLDSIEPAELPKFIGSKLDDQMFTALLRGLNLLAASSSNRTKNVYAYFRSLADVKRFDIIKMFISEQSRQLILETLGHLEPNQADHIKTLYGI